MFETSSLVAYIVAILVIALVLYFTTRPIKWIIKTVLNGLLGGVMLFAINYVGRMIGFSIPINPINAVIAGALGLPGVILLVIIGLVL